MPDRLSRRLVSSVNARLEAALDHYSILGSMVERIDAASGSRVPSRREIPIPRINEDDPLVSVVIPCFNYGAYLGRSVRSVLAQGVPLEVVIIDDASTDHSGSVAEELAAADERVRYFRNPANQGHIGSVNRGYAEARGEFIMRLDADDMLTPGSLGRSLDLFMSHPEVGLVYGHPIHFETDPPPPARIAPRSWTIWAGRDWIAERCRLGVNCITSVEAVMRASILRRVGFLDERLRQAEDLEQWIRIAAVSDVGHLDGADQGYHRDHPASMTAGIDTLTDLQYRRLALQIAFERLGGRLSEAPALRERAMATLASEALDRAARAYDRGRTAAEPIDQYVAYAIDTYAGAGQLPEWRALERRRVIRSVPPSWWPPFMLQSVLRRAREEALYLRWRRTGV